MRYSKRHGEMQRQRPGRMPRTEAAERKAAEEKKPRPRKRIGKRPRRAWQRWLRRRRPA